MNIAFCHASVVPARGGAEAYIAELAQRLSADGHHLHLYAARCEGLPDAIIVHPVSDGSGPRFLRSWRFAWACRRASQARPHDLTVGFGDTWGQDVLFALGGVYRAAVAFERGLGLGRWIDPRHWSLLLFERRRYGAGNRPLIVVNSMLDRDLLQAHHQVSAQDLHLIRPPLEPARFPEHDRLKRRQETRDRWGLGPSEVVALFASTDFRRDGLLSLLAAVRQLGEQTTGGGRGPIFRLAVTGAQARAVFDRLARGLGIGPQLRFLGCVPAMRDVYFASDLLVHPTAYDSCSRAVVEALSCGLPVISAKRDGASELIHPPHEGFVLDDADDATELAWCLGQLLDPARRHACTLAARKTAAAWSFDQHYRQLLEVLHEAAARKRAA